MHWDSELGQTGEQWAGVRHAPSARTMPSRWNMKI